MELFNQTSLTEFLIMGLSENPLLQIPLVIMFSLLYIMTLLGNLVIVAIICFDKLLQTPMYYFLSNLSFLDIGFTSVTIPKMLSVCSTGNNSISFSACILQFYLCFSFLSTEFFLLSVMALDRYVAICNPLRYTVIMSKRVVALLAVASWVLGFLNIIPHTMFISNSFFCGSNKIKHFFCDFTALLKLSCTDPYYINIATFCLGAVSGLGPFMLTITSYVLIVSNILKLPSARGRQKLFSTCSSHLTTVVLFYGTELGLYMRPTSGLSLEKDKFFAVLFTVVIPVLNPIVYSLRNQDVKRAVTKIRLKIWYRDTMLH
ncbi:olfactory receptor 5AP2-like [Lissotriton helveticus]